MLKRIIFHWSAGSHVVSALDREHYHYIISGAGEAVAGRFSPEDNIKPVKGRYAAHTLNFNTGSIGLALAAMAGAVERPFNPGNFPITEIQLERAIKLAASLSCKHNIPVSRETILSHAEVQHTLKIQQRGKWDITWIPGMSSPASPVAVGDEIRKRIATERAKIK